MFFAAMTVYLFADTMHTRAQGKLNKAFSAELTELRENQKRLAAAISDRKSE